MTVSLFPSWEVLEDLPTTCVAQTCDLKFEQESPDPECGDAVQKVLVWLARTSIEDGEPFRETVYVEILSDGRWVDLGYYDGENPVERVGGYSVEELRIHV